MTPQAFSYGTLGNDGKIYIPPYGLEKNVDQLLIIDPDTYGVETIFIQPNDTRERWTNGITYKDKIYFLPYGEHRILIVDTVSKQIEFLEPDWPENTKNIHGKYFCVHRHGSKIVSLPYGEYDELDYVIVFDMHTHKTDFVKLDLPVNDYKKWHTSQMIDGIIYGVPRGERWTVDYFPYRIEFDCDSLSYSLINMKGVFGEFNDAPMCNKKYTTLAKSNNSLYAPPYSENPDFDIMLKMINNKWSYEHTNLKQTSRKYFTHVTAKNGKIYFPPAGHDEDWSEMMIVDPVTDTWKIIKCGVGKESKKYFAGCESSQGKIFWIPRGGCVCEPEETWKKFGDLVEVLVLDTKDDSLYTIDISEYFTDNTTIEKYNHCLIYKDKIFAFPYGESSSFQTLLIFDTIQEKVIRTIDLNAI